MAHGAFPFQIPTGMYELSTEYLKGPYPLEALLKLSHALGKMIKLNQLCLELESRDALGELPMFRADRELDEFKLISGVDGGSRGKELQLGYLSLVTAVGYTSESNRLADPNPISDAELYLIPSSEGAFWTGLLERLSTLDVAIQVARDRAPDAILLDGGLLLKPTYLMAHAIDGRCFKLSSQSELDSSSYHLQLDECLRMFCELISICYREQIALIGVVKRPTSDLLESGIRDIALLTKKLQLGQACGPFYPSNHIAQRHYFRLLKQIPSKIGVIYLRSSRSKGPIRLEFPEWLDPAQAASLVYKICDPITGIPVHILKADRIAKVSSGLFQTIYLRLLLNLSQEQQHLMAPIYGEELLISDPELSSS